MSAQAKSFSPEERQSYRAWMFGTTLDWESLILAEIDYPAENRWYVAAVQGICQKAPPKIRGKGVPIARSLIAKRAGKFKNKAQAKELTKRAETEDREWSRLKRMMVLDIENPKPHEVEGAGKRARIKFTDYLTAAAVYAQDVEHRVKKSDELRWKKDTKYRVGKRREILEEAIKMLPSFGSKEDMPPSCQDKPEKAPLSMGEYIVQREKILLAENKRILDRLLEGDLTTEDELNERLMLLQLHYEKSSHEIEERYQSSREVLIGMLNARKFSTPTIFEPADAPLLEGSDTPYRNATDSCKGNVGIPLSGSVPQTPAPLETSRQREDLTPAKTASEGERGHTPSESQKAAQKGNARIPLLGEPVAAVWAAVDGDLPVSVAGFLGYGNDGRSYVSVAGSSVGVPLVEIVYPDGSPHLLVWALYWALSEGFPVVPAYSTAGKKCACHLGDKCRSAGKHPMHDARDLPDGLANASTLEAQVRAWWTRWPSANILGRMKDGRRLGFDVDVQAGGDANFYSLVEARGESWIQTRTHKTGAGGFHLFFDLPEGFDFRKGKFCKGIDLKWTNGGMVLPPSIHHSGNRYEVIDPSVELSAPEWMLDELVGRVKQAGKVIDFQEGAQKFADNSKQKFYESNHERNTGLFGLLFGRWLHGFMANSAEFYQQAHALNQARCAPPLDSDEVEKLCDDFLANYSHLKDSEAEQEATA
jgi:hypothetical protein